MKRYCFALIGIFVLVLALAGTSYSWQGRMGGMGDPYGLLEDESDFLIHPAKIVAGEGVRLYGGYRFTYTGVVDWSYRRYLSNWVGVYYGMDRYDYTGEEYGHEVLLGSSFPLGGGRLGLFLTYDGMRGYYDADIVTYWAPGSGQHFERESDLDAIAVRLIYGLPLDGFSLGGEIQLASRQEAKQLLFYRDDTNLVMSNPWDWSLTSFHNFFVPYDSSYIEALLKGSLEGAIGPIETAFTLRGGLILGGGDNEWDQSSLFSGTRGRMDLDGGVEGWKIGGDLWARYPVSDSLALPFLVRVDYQAKTRDGDGAGWGNLWPTTQFDYENTERSFEIVVGGGLDRVLDAGTRVAGGIYYHYLQGKNDLSLDRVTPAVLGNEYYVLPDGVEHRVMVRLVGERELSPAVAMRAGLDCFYGWVRQERSFTFKGSMVRRDINVPMDGPHWGIGGSLGGSVRFQRFTLEPFVGGGYQSLDMAGDGETVENGILLSLSEQDESRGEWFVGGGVALTLGSQVHGGERRSEGVAERSLGGPSVTTHTCPKCGRTFPAEYAFCPYDKTPFETTKRCPECGRTFPAEYVYCPYDKTTLEPVHLKK
jgi:hypothetical protein